MAQYSDMYTPPYQSIGKMSRQPILIDEVINRRLILAFYLAQGAAGLVYNVEFAERSIN